MGVKLKSKMIRAFKKKIHPNQCSYQEVIAVQSLKNKIQTNQPETRVTDASKAVEPPSWVKPPGAEPSHYISCHIIREPIRECHVTPRQQKHPISASCSFPVTRQVSEIHEHTRSSPIGEWDTHAREWVLRLRLAPISRDQLLFYLIVHIFSQITSFLHILVNKWGSPAQSEVFIQFFLKLSFTLAHFSSFNAVCWQFCQTTCAVKTFRPSSHEGQLEKCTSLGYL